MLSAYFLAAACYKRMRLTTSFYGISDLQLDPRQLITMTFIFINVMSQMQTLTRKTAHEIDEAELMIFTFGIGEAENAVCGMK